MSWAWEYAFGAGETARTAAAALLAAVERKSAELLRAAEAQYLHGRAHREGDPKGGDITVPGGMFRYQIVVRAERVYIVQITYLDF